eukprot:182100_1
MNAVECSLFYLEARMFQMKGYTQLFQDASKLTKINFRFSSMYCVLTFAVYSFLLRHHVNYLEHSHDMDIIFLAVWCFAYVFVIGCLCKSMTILHRHNRDQPKPDLFFPHPNNDNYIKNSPLSRPPQNRSSIISVPEEQTEVIQKLYKDKSTLIRQLNNWKRKHELIKGELQQMQNDNASLVDAQGGAALSGGGLISNDVIELKHQIQKLRCKLRTEREQGKTLNAQIDTKKTMLDAQIAETE